jgi:2-polyprenyl-3-methyl-5-hydroxy-6-metoxy-1,4-benzoquinol methylase
MQNLDSNKLNALIGKMIGDLGGAFSVPTVRIGFSLGLFDSLHKQGPATPSVLAQRLELDERQVTEWALAQAANGYLSYDAQTNQFSLSPEQAMVFAEPDSPVYLSGAFDLAAEMVHSQPKVEAAFRSGKGVGWGESSRCLFCAVGSFFRPGYVNSITQAWLPALEGIVPRLEAGAKVADIGCGVGFSTLLMASAFPKSTFVGYDFHEPSIAQARGHAIRHDLADRVRFEAIPAKAISERDFDLVTMFDCLHDMGDPDGCARHIRTILKPDGAWMLVEPIASDDVTENIANPVSRLYYNGSTMICVPTSKAQEVGAALGAQAGEARLSTLLKSAGFSKVGRATEGPFNMVLEARP